jgi:hypothetical protein
MHKASREAVHRLQQLLISVVVGQLNAFDHDIRVVQRVGHLVRDLAAHVKPGRLHGSDLARDLPGTRQAFYGSSTGKRQHSTGARAVHRQITYETMGNEVRQIGRGGLFFARGAVIVADKRRSIQKHRLIDFESRVVRCEKA